MPNCSHSFPRSVKLPIVSWDPELVKTMTIAMDDALTWNTVVGKQYRRILEADNEFDRQMEMYLFAFAVRQVLRGAALAHEIVEAAGLTDRIDVLRLARAGFDGRVPHAVHVRNMLEHFDDYRLGKGRLQRGWTIKDFFQWVEHDEGGNHVLVLAAQYRLPIADTKAACDYLTHEVVRALRAA